MFADSAEFKVGKMLPKHDKFVKGSHNMEYSVVKWQIILAQIDD